ncbi:hypothetical protein Y032_0063g3445 [Ancylostoma ceylanicum]|uniref:Peptidase family M13 n=1 Tax=Ancylostoma ceylanicum TaxID=53326 RepID=A0A016U248_9BILA|nr:hypothetical protein Y032_0063g3445 [Ancylostoma ceylanicum]
MADLENLLAEIDVSETFAPISAAIRALTRVIDESHFTLAGQLQSIHNACLELLERSKPKSPCIFCSLTENLDSHSTMRCNRFPDPVSKALQAARLQLCERCLKAQHDGEDCGINFEQYITTVFKGLANVSPNHTVIIREMEYFAGIQHILSTTPKRVIANYIAWRLVQGFSPFLPPTAREPFYQFKANQTGMFNSPPPDRWEDCVTLSVIMMDMPVGKLFVEHFFERERAMAKMHELTGFLKGEFIKQLRVLDWMDESTRRRAVEKAGMIEYKNGFPDVLFNDTWMDEHWGILIKPKEYLLHLTIRIKLARYAEELMRLDQPLDRSMWYQSPAQVDAYYAPNNNEMIFPAGIMQFPFLTLGVPNYITYGMVGAVIGHEVSHAFDDQGGRYDELGNLNDWWDTETAEKFTEKTRCFVRQYGSVKVAEAGIHLNGQLSLGENIADNGGVKTAFNAYKAWRANTSEEEPALPGFQNFTSEQMFFLAYANNKLLFIKPSPDNHTELFNY